MYPPRDRKLLCRCDPWRVQRQDIVSEKMEDNGTGGKVRVKRFSDGSSRVEWGGMGGTVCYDEFGEEC